MTHRLRRSGRVVRAVVALAVLTTTVVLLPSTSGATRPTVSGGFISTTPVRAYNSQTVKDGPCLSTGSVRTVSIPDRTPVPKTATAVALNITVVRPATSGYLTVFPTGVPRPTASNINFSAGQIVPNSALVGLGTNGQISVFVLSTCAHVIIDVVGYFVGGRTGALPTSVSNGSFNGLTPQRALDTRSSGPCLAGGGTRTIQVAGSFGVPANAVAVAVNVTAVTPTGPGYLVAFPGGTARPTASTLNFATGDIVANATSVKLGGGKISIFSGITAPCTHVLVDVVGYYAAGNPSTPVVAPGGFGPQSPTRVFDSRSALFGAACIPGGSTRTITVLSPGSVPNGTMLNITVTSPTASGYLTAFTGSGARPATSSLNFVAGQTIANGVVVRPSLTGTVSLFVSTGCAHVIVDRVGSFAAGGEAPGVAGPPGVVAGQSLDRDGTAASARVPAASWIARNATTGDLYVTETELHTVRKIAPNGEVTTLAGFAGQPGSTNGTGTAARFDSPRGVVVLANGDLLVADGGNATLRKITPTGVVTTFAGTAGARGTANATGSGARFNFPAGLALRADGSVVVTDSGNHDVRLVDPAGVVTRVAGTPGTSGTTDGASAAAQFSGPTGVAVLADGRIAVADTLNNTVRMITSNLASVSTYAGTSNQAALTFSGGSANGDGLLNARFNQPMGLVATSTGDLLVVDHLGHGVRRINTEQFVTTEAGTLNASGFVNGGVTSRLSRPIAIVGDGAGSFWVTDHDNSAVRTLDPTPFLSVLVGGPDSTRGRDDAVDARLSYLNAPSSAAADANGTVYIADTGNCTIRRVAVGAVQTLAGQPGQCSFVDGAASTARFNAPRGVTVGLDGNIYVADTGNHVIRKITPAGVVTTLAGARTTSGGVLVPQPGYANGTSTVAQFTSPTAITTGPTGDLFVADAGTNTIRRVFEAGGAAGVVETYSGWFGGDNGTNVSFPSYANPVGIAVDAQGFVYVADQGHDQIRKIDPAARIATPVVLNALDGAFVPSPQGVAVDDLGSVYTTSAGRLFASRDGVALFGGSAALPYPFLVPPKVVVTGSASRSFMVEPAQVTYGDDGRLYVADRSGNAVVRVN